MASDGEFDVASGMYRPQTANEVCPLRFLITHFNDSSARFRYLVLDGQICAPKPLPKLVMLCETVPAVELHAFPGTWIAGLCRQLELLPTTLQLIAGWVRWIETPRGFLPVYLIRAAGPEPFPVSGTAHWRELPECFRFTPLERQLLRAAYDHYVA